MMRRLRYLIRLYREFVGYTLVNKSMMPITLVTLLLVIAAIAVVTQVATPFIYTIF